MTRGIWIALGGLSVVVVALALALALSLTGDEHQPPSAIDQPPSAGALAPERMQEFEDCLAEHGVEPPEPGSTPQGPPKGIEDALEACEGVLPDELVAPAGGAPHSVPFGPPG